MCMGVRLSRFLGANVYKSTIQYKGGSELRCSLWKKCCGCDMSFKFIEKNVVLDARNNIDKDVKNK